MSLERERVAERSKEGRLWSLVPEQKILAKIWIYIYKAGKNALEKNSDMISRVETWFCQKERTKLSKSMIKQIYGRCTSATEHS